MSTRTPPGYARGILSIWNDIAPDAEDFYERWYMTQHFPERLGVPGFLRGRRYLAIDADRKYFTFYELEAPEVLFSPAYVARQNAPTAWTATVMRSWGPMFRTVCERVRRKGEAIGGFCLVARWEGNVTLPIDLADRIFAMLDDPAVAAVDHWRASERQNDTMKEATLRPVADRTIGAALVIETTREAALASLTERLPGLLGSAPTPSATGTYRLIAAQDAPS